MRGTQVAGRAGDQRNLSAKAKQVLDVAGWRCAHV